MVPDLAVLSVTDSFSELWPKMVPSVGGRLRAGTEVAELGRLDETCGVLIAAAGSEFDLVDVIEQLLARKAPSIAVTGAETDYRLAITLFQAGVRAYYALPADLGMLRSWMAERVEDSIARDRARKLAAAQREQYDFSRLIGRSPALLAALARAAKVIPRATSTVLITGETGTGKELLARALHYNGPRGPKPFVEINCTALPENLLEAELFGYEAGAFTDARVAKPGLMEAANGGTLFLDEIGDLSLKLQGKLLRVLEEKRVRRLGSLRDQEIDLRIIAATHVDLIEAVQEKRFRQDLYYRLAVVPIELPALRHRGDDILMLAEHFLDRFSGDYEVGPLALPADIRRTLLSHSWPGNVRELRNAIERAVLLGDGGLDANDLFVGRAMDAPHSHSALPFPAPMSQINQAAAHAMLEWCGGNKSEAAKVLGISRKHLYELLKHNPR